MLIIAQMLKMIKDWVSYYIYMDSNLQIWKISSTNAMKPIKILEGLVILYFY